MSQYRITLCTRDRKIIHVYNSSVAPIPGDQIAMLPTVPKDELFLVEGRILTAHLPNDICIVGKIT